jgi:hypothetical protein
MPYLVEIVGDDGRTDRQLIEEKRLPKIAIFSPCLRSKISASHCPDVGVFGERPLCARSGRLLTISQVLRERPSIGSSRQASNC